MSRQNVTPPGLVGAGFSFNSVLTEGQKMRLLRMMLPLMALLGLMAPATAQTTGPLVLAAASLQESLTAAADAFAAQGNPRPVISYAASSALAKQIDAGSPADIFISADEPWMDFVAKKGLINPGTRVSFLTNRLVLIAPAAQPLKIDIRSGFPLAAALGDGKLAMADPDSVPAGKYGKAALTNLGVWTDVEPKVVRGENVRAALVNVATGNARAGIVYETDAKASKDVVVVGVFPAASHAPITYPLATLAGAKNPGTEKFRAYLLSDAGKAIFTKYGFGTR
jgi:molybdate transport system substrate-binding protein